MRITSSLIREPIRRSAFTLVLLCVGCASTNQRVDPARDSSPGRSFALSAALASVIDEAVRDLAARSGRVPRLSGRSDEIDRLLAEMASRYPSVLETTPEEEQRLREGRVNYAARMNELRGISRRVSREQIGLPIVSSYLLRQFDRGQLVGVRLELAARLLRAQLDDPRIVGFDELRRGATHQPEG